VAEADGLGCILDGIGRTVAEAEIEGLGIRDTVVVLVLLAETLFVVPMLGISVGVAYIVKVSRDVLDGGEVCAYRPFEIVIRIRNRNNILFDCGFWRVCLK